jgi:hypothetical protein
MIKVGWLLFGIVLQLLDQFPTARNCCRMISEDTDFLGLKSSIANLDLNEPLIGKTKVMIFSMRCCLESEALLIVVSSQDL